MKLIHALKLPLKYLLIWYMLQFCLSFIIGSFIGFILPYNVVPKSLTTIVGILCKISALYIYIPLLKNEYENENLNAILKVNKLSLKNIIIISIFAIALTFCDSLLCITSLKLINTFTTYTGYNKITAFAQLAKSSYLALFNLIIISPIFEEILFRGMIFNSLKKNIDIVVAIVLQAFIFSVVHGNIIQFIYAFLGGIIYGIIYFKTNSLVAPMLMHIIGNFVGIIGINFVSNNLHNYIWIIYCISIMTAIISFIWIMRINSNNKSKCTSSIK